MGGAAHRHFEMAWARWPWRSNLQFLAWLTNKQRCGIWIYARMPGHGDQEKHQTEPANAPPLSGAKLSKFLKYFGLAFFQFKLRKLPPSRGRARFFGDLGLFLRRTSRKIHSPPQAPQNFAQSKGELTWEHAAGVGICEKCPRAWTDGVRRRLAEIGSRRMHT